MWIPVGFAILALLAVPLVLSILRSTELFVIDVRDGKVSLRRGRLPPKLLAEIEDIVAHPPLKTALVRVIAENAKPRVMPDPGLSKGTLQQLRNVVGRFEVSQIRTGKRRG